MNDADWTQTAAGESEPHRPSAKAAGHWNKSMDYQQQQRDAERTHGHNSDQARALGDKAASERAAALAAGYDPMSTGADLNDMTRGGGLRGSRPGGRSKDRRGSTRSGSDRRGDNGLLGPKSPPVDQ